MGVSNPTMHRGIVKEVRSGDTLIVTGPPTQCPPVEVQITISGIIAPRLARRGGETDDAPYAWAAREHLRQLVIGKPIDFSTDGNFGDRQFSTCYFNGQNLALGLVTKGLVSCKDKGSGPEFEALQDAETEARANGLGVHCDAPNEFATRPEVDREFDVKAWHRKLPQGQPLTAIVEWVRDPCTLSCLIVPEFKQILVSLSGVAGPRILRATEEGGQAVPQPFYYQAKHITESLMLNRNVELHIESVEGNGTAVGSILTSEGNIARPEMAWSCKLAHVEAPEISAEYGRDAAGFLEDMVMRGDVSLVAHIVDNYQGELKVMLYPSDNQIDSASINAQMAETGCVRLATGRKAGKIPDDLYHAEAMAKKERRALWEFGDS